MSEFEPRLLELLRRLVAADIQFVIVGGFAVIGWGYVRGTEDIDIVPAPDRENLDRLAALLEELGGTVQVEERRLAPSAIRVFLEAGDKALVPTELGTVDVLQGIPQIPRFEELAEAASEAEVEGVRVLVCSLQHLIAMKRAADRLQDRADLEALRVAHPDAFRGEEPPAASD